MGQNPANSLKAGENALDIVAEERCLWGGVGYLELKLEVEKTGLVIPYFNQKELPWGPHHEYDHADSVGPFKCGNTLKVYGDDFKGIRRYMKTNSDFSGLLIVADAPTEFLVIDPQGRTTGNDSETGFIFNETPNSSYYLQPPLSNDSINDTLAPPETGTLVFELSKPTSGQYMVITNNNAGEILFLLMVKKLG